MPKSNEKQRRRESPAGYHFYWLLRENPRHWYIKYGLGLRPAHTSPPLIRGGSLHEAIEKYYKSNFSIKKAIETYLTELNSRKDEYEDGEKFEEDLKLGPQLLQTWYETWHDEDRKLYDVVEVETEHEFRVGPEPGFVFTVRPDLVLRSKQTKALLVDDYKSTYSSVSGSFNLAEHQDQLTSYIWAIKRAYPDDIVEGAIVDILYARGKVRQAARPGMIYRTDQELRIWEMELVGTIIEASQKFKALQDMPYPLLFPRNGLIDAVFGCEYEGICRTPPRPGVVPPGFVRDEWRELAKVMDEVPDFNLENWELNTQEVKPKRNSHNSAKGKGKDKQTSGGKK